MRSVSILFASALLSCIGCYSSIQTVDVNDVLFPFKGTQTIINNPEVGEEIVVGVGEVLFTYTKGTLSKKLLLTTPALGSYKDGATLDEDGNRVREILVYPGYYYWTHTDLSGQEYYKAGFLNQRQRFLVIRNEIQVVDLRADGRTIKNVFDVTADWEVLSDVFIEDEEYIRWELVFTGMRDANTISLLYREFLVQGEDGAQLIREAFNMPLTYVVNAPQTIQYKGVDIEVLSLQNNSVHAKVLAISQK